MLGANSIQGSWVPPAVPFGTTTVAMTTPCTLETTSTPVVSSPLDVSHVFSPSVSSGSPSYCEGGLPQHSLSEHLDSEVDDASDREFSPLDPSQALLEYLKRYTDFVVNFTSENCSQSESMKALGFYSPQGVEPHHSCAVCGGAGVPFRQQNNNNIITY